MSHSKYVEKYLNKIKAEVAEPNKTLILDFVAQERAENRSESRILEYVRKVYEIEKMLEKPFKKAERRDTVNIVNSFSSFQLFYHKP
jgi:sugar-specific transcriptional regulator TrmB